MQRRSPGSMMPPVLLLFGLILLWAEVTGATTADDLCSSTANPCVVTGTVVVTPGSTIDVGARELRVVSGGTLLASGGAMELLAEEITVLAGGKLDTRGSASSRGGSITSTASVITIAGTIDSSGSPPGGITMNAGNELIVSGSLVAKGLSADDDGGNVRIRGGTLDFSGAISATGGAEGYGGSVTLAASGDVEVSGDVDASGGEGGDVTVEAGQGGAEGNVVITSATVFEANARATGGAGGEIDISAGGNGTITGNIIFQGLLEAKGHSGTEDTGGGWGGTIALSADGGVVNDIAAGGIDASGGGPDGDGGTIEIAASAGSVVTSTRLRARSAAIESAGGEIELAGEEVAVKGEIDAVGGGYDGGSVYVASEKGDIVIDRAAKIDASSAVGGGYGGDVSLEAYGHGVSRLVVNGSVTADGSGSIDWAGDGGTIGLVADAEIVVGSDLAANGSAGGGQGGELTVSVKSGGAAIDGDVTLNGNGVGGSGGDIDLEAAGPIVITGNVEVRGLNGAEGGTFALSSGGGTTLDGSVTADGSRAADGGGITVICDGDVGVAGSLSALSGGQATGGGTVKLTGCGIDVTATGALESSGPESLNRIKGREQIHIAGIMSADAATGLNEIHFRSGFLPQITGSIDPMARLIADPSLIPCAVIPPTSTPTYGSEQSPTPSLTPTPTEVPTACVGDCDGSGTVTIDELIRGVNIALGGTSVDLCSQFDANANGSVTIDELVRGVNAALSGCAM